MPGPPLIADAFTPWLDAHRGELDAIVFDVDGVLMTGHKPTPGSAALIDRLRQDRTPFALLTNDGCHSPEEKVDLLRQCGMDFRVSEVVSSSHGMVELAEDRGWTEQRFYVMGEISPCYARDAGVEITEDLGELGRCQGIIIGERHYDWDRVFNAVFNFLLGHPSAPLVVPNPDDYFVARDGSLYITSGAIARFLARLCRTCGRPLEPHFLGKPYRPIFLHSHRSLEARTGKHLDPHRVMILGDSLASDVQGGLDFGYRTALLLTGITTRDMLAGSDIAAEIVFEGL